LFALTRNKRYKLRVDLADFNGSSRYAEYSEFRVASGYDKFKLVSLGTFSGNAGKKSIFVNLTRYLSNLKYHAKTRYYPPLS
jgi:hypothetical protein